MKSKLPLCILVLVALWAGRVSWAQAPPVGDVDPEVQEALEKLKATEPFRRNDVVKEIAKLGPRAVPAVVAVVTMFRQETDAHYVAACIKALGLISGLDAPQRRAASEALIAAMQAPGPQIPYAAATALSSIWTGSGTDQIATLRNVNAALAAAVLERLPDDRTYAPAMALIVINRIQTGAIKPSSLSTADLSKLSAEWVARSPQWLPPLREQPWPLILARMTEGESAAARQEGKDALTLVRSLPVVDRIVQMLRDEATSTALWGDLADVIGGISGVRYPAGITPENRAVAADDWMVKWDQSLKGRKDEAHRLYNWRRFEVAIDRARKDTSPEVAERVATVRGILVHQLDSPDDIPADASPYARQMLEKPLAAKQDMLSALEDLEKAVRPDEKMVAATRIRDLADTDELKGIVRLHMERLVTAVLREDDREVLDVLAGLLTAVTGVPLNLRQDSAQEREKILREWLRMLP